MPGGNTARALALAVVCGLPAAVHAVDPQLADTNVPTRAHNVQNFGNWLEWDNMTGNWGGVRSEWKEAGFTPFVSYTSELLSNVAGGIQTGANLNGFVEFGFGLDYEKLLGWEGSAFYIDWHWYHGNTISQNLVGINPGENISGYEASQAFRFYTIYQEQRFFDDKLTLRLGQMASDSYFALSQYDSMFFNAAFGALPTTDTISSVPIYPLTAPGVYLETQPFEWLLFRAVCFTADAGPDVVTNNGFGWSVGGEAGVAVMAESVFLFDIGDLPSAIKLGGIYDFGPHTNLYTLEEEYGVGDMWLVLDQALAVDEAGETKVAAFSILSFSPSQDIAALNFWVDAGFSFFGVIPSRPDDTFGIAFGYSELTAGGQQTFQSLAGVPSPPNTTFLEMTYQYSVSPWLQLQPDLQLVFDPNLADQDAVVIGFRTIFTF